MTAMPAETPPTVPSEEVVQLLINNVPKSVRTRIRILAARKDVTMTELEVTALRIGLEVLESQDEGS
jgi:hypothetical protein